MSRLVVTKFGGSSVADSTRFADVKAIVTADEDRTVVVPSAPGKRFDDDHKVTDLLYMCHQLASHHIDIGDVFSLVEERYLQIRDGLSIDLDIEDRLRQMRDQIESGVGAEHAASRGEYLNGLLLAEYLGYRFVDASEVIVFDESGKYDEAATINRLATTIGKDDRVVIPGFYGADAAGVIHTFSRGGSDVTGAIVAQALDADLYENWTDVPGFLQADPRVVQNPKPIAQVTYKELRELSYMGASVLHEEAIFPVRKKGIPIRVCSTLAPGDPGTLIVKDNGDEGFEGITGIAGMRDFTVVTLEKALLNEERGFLRKLVSVFETNGVSIAHAPSGIDSVSVIARSEDLRFKMSKVLAELKIYCRPDVVSVEEGVSLLAVVGRGMVRTPGIAGTIFSALADAGVNIRIITQGASEMSIIIGIEDEDFEVALQALYEVA